MFNYPPKIQTKILSKVIREEAETCFLTYTNKLSDVTLVYAKVNFFVHTKVQTSKDTTSLKRNLHNHCLLSELGLISEACEFLLHQKELNLQR